MAESTEIGFLQDTAILFGQRLTAYPPAAWDAAAGDDPPHQAMEERLETWHQDAISAQAARNSVWGSMGNTGPSVTTLSARLDAMLAIEKRVAGQIAVDVKALPADPYSMPDPLVSPAAAYADTGLKALKDYAANPLAGVKATLVGDKTYGSSGLAGAAGNADISLRSYGMILGVIVVIGLGAAFFLGGRR
jgi:hypothetical protein